MENIQLGQWKVSGSLPYQADFSPFITEGRLFDPPTNLVPWIDATVPGSIYRDLERAGFIEEPYFDRNSLHCEWVGGRWWTYRTAFTVTAEQLLYQGTKVLKYLSVIPLGMMFLLTTNPSEFAASLSSIGVSYKAAFAVSLTLRYFPDMIRDYNDIALAQQARGLDLSRKERIGTRLKNIMNIFVPLIFSSLDRVEVISNAMDLRGFGKHKKRTWYAFKPLVKNDGLAMAICVAIALAALGVAFFVDHGRYWNPFIA